MKLNHDISLRHIREPPELKAEILLGGEPTGKYVKADSLEAAVQWQDKTLLLVTDNLCFPEAIEVLLLDKELNIVDSALVGITYGYGVGNFENLQLIEPDMVRFDFSSKYPWEIQLLSKPQCRIPFLSEPLFGVLRPFGFSRQFIVRRAPLPKKEDLFTQF